MVIRFKDGIYVADAEYREKDALKAAGFIWTRLVPTKWATKKPECASKLARFADTSCREALEKVAGERAESLQASRATDAAIEVPCPEGLAYMPFQRAGIAFGISHPAVFIADEMGLGKTIEAIGIINALEWIKRVLVVAPASLKLNWRSELKKWLVRSMRVTIVDGAVPRDGIAIINYEQMKKFREALRGETWDMLIVDEIHYCKSSKAQRTTEVFGGTIKKCKTCEKVTPTGFTANGPFCRKCQNDKESVAPIKTKRKTYMTGSPILNKTIELWNIVHDLDPVTWNNWRRYVTRYCAAFEGRHGWDVSGASHLDELQEILRSTIMIRRLKKDVLTELPPKTRQVIELPAGSVQVLVDEENQAFEEFEEELEDLRANVELAKASESVEDYMQAVDRLRDAANVAFTQISKMRHRIAVAKVPVIIEHVTEALESQDKVFVLTHHLDVANALAEALKEFNPVMHNGDVSLLQRQANIDRFQTDPTCRILLGAIATAVGYTATAASLCIAGELDWTPGRMSQAEDRLHRIGQRDNVLVQHIVLDGSLDARMAKTLVAKQEVIDQALDRQPEADEPIVPTAGLQQEHTTRKQIAEDAEKLTGNEIALIHKKLMFLAGICDYAGKRDGAGYNKLDARIGHSLASQKVLTPRQAALGAKILHKYEHTQLKGVAL